MSYQIRTRCSGFRNSGSSEVMLNASYQGTFYLPSVSAEAMYDATKHARTAGYTVEVRGLIR